ncbi:gamma-interferon-inducible lysosomal thiol reductase-like [Leucoraja erinacea]|uniref:gamma-interferon-inducible lysosomal thiol reductase-like n=1 Tax=Leucoraja erinaceus TaxID=7782 RepID=UPI002456C9BB|nr:gamma-interferon-inducible lysosomal thiol reductase-like [Leucoraja erinacea]
MKFLVNLFILSLCAVGKRCSNTEAGDWPPVHISLFYESRCPDCSDFVVHELCPVWMRMREVLNITLIPFGNAEIIQGAQGVQYLCQHGEEECLGNMIQSCMIHHLKNTSSYLPVICCMESAHTVVATTQQCLQDHAPALTWETISDCVDGELGARLMQVNARLTTSLEPPHRYVPWILINGVHSEDIQHHAEGDLLELVCQTYTGSLPAVCGQRI